VGALGVRVIGLRHGQSQYNLLGLCNDDPARHVDLTDCGVRQAEAAARQLLSESIVHVYCSPLLRARRTAQIIASALGCAVAVDDRLADIRSGFDGRPVADYLSAIAGDPLNTCVNGGESLADYRRRVDGFLAWLVEQPLPCVLLVAHEETLRIFDAFFSGRGLADVVGKSFANCVPYVFQPASEN